MMVDQIKASLPTGSSTVPALITNTMPICLQEGDVTSSGVLLGTPNYCPISYKVAMENNLPMPLPVNKWLRFTAGHYTQGTIFHQELNENIIADLGPSVFRLKAESYLAPYQKDKRVFRLAYFPDQQWVLDPRQMRDDGLKILSQMDVANDEVRQNAEKVFDQEKWALSSKLGTGVPLPVVLSETGDYISNKDVVDRFRNIFDPNDPKSINMIRNWWAERHNNPHFDVNNEFCVKPVDSFCSTFTHASAPFCMNPNPTTYDFATDTVNNYENWLGRSLVLSGRVKNRSLRMKYLWNCAL